MKKLELDLELVLPQDAAACAACLGRIQLALQNHRGISDVHVHDSRLCVHYEPGTVSVDEVRSRVERAGASLAGRYEHVSMLVAGLRHERHARLVEAALQQTPGVLQAAVAFGTNRIVIELDAEETSRARVLAAIAAAGLEPQPEPTPSKAGEDHDDHSGHDHSHKGPFGERSELIFSIACGVVTALGWLLNRLAVPHQLATAAYVTAYVLGASYLVREVAVALRARRFEIDFLMLVAAGGAAAIGEWADGALLLFLFSLGHALEGFAMGRARKAIEGLAKLVPKTAIVVDESGNETEVAVDALAVGSWIRVKPNTRVPADGVVIRGTSSVDQSPITGESVPVDKAPVPNLHAALARPADVPAQHRVFAGTVNGPSELIVLVSRVSADSTLSRVVKLVSEAQTQKSATQLFTDRFERVFVPVVLALVVTLLFAWVVIDEPFVKSLYRAMAVLVAASPCALAIATPSAVLAGVARAARSGVLIKGGAHLEELGRIQVVAFDKTGTLTEGKPKLTDIRPSAGVEPADLLRIALAVEKRSDHPLAHAIVMGATERLRDEPLLEAADARAVIGFGIEARVNGELIRIGKPGMFTNPSPLPAETAALTDELTRTGRTVMIVQRGETFLGVLGVMDTPRPSAAVVVGKLKALGPIETVMLSGDNQRVAEAIARQVGVDQARGDLLPEDKVKFITEQTRAGRRVAMIGDGVNDAPALASATVGIAMGAGGSDVALEAADVALMADDLTALPLALELSRSARRIVLQNLWASLGMVAFLIPATLFGFAGIGLAVALHEGSTLLVVANALRLLAWRGSKNAT